MSQVLYHSDKNWILEILSKLNLSILEAVTASLIPSLIILMTEATGENKTTQPATQM